MSTLLLKYQKKHDKKNNQLQCNTIWHHLAPFVVSNLKFLEVRRYPSPGNRGAIAMHVSHTWLPPWMFCNLWGTLKGNFLKISGCGIGVQYCRYCMSLYSICTVLSLAYGCCVMFYDLHGWCHFLWSAGWKIYVDIRGWGGTYQWMGQGTGAVGCWGQRFLQVPKGGMTYRLHYFVHII